MEPKVLEKLLEIGRKMAENRILDPLLEYAMMVALELVGAERGYIVILNEDNTFDYRIMLTRDGETLKEPEKQISHTILEKVTETQKSIVIADAISDPAFLDAESIAMLRLRSVMCVPLKSRDKMIGAIYVENRSDKGIFHLEDAEPLEYFASQTAVAIENAMLNDDLEERVTARTAELAQINEMLREENEERKRMQADLHKLSITDPLTNIYNRRHFYNLAEREFDRTKRYKQSLSIILLDIDEFKIVNDTYGHAVGDQVLRMVTRNISRNLREVDIFARYGGEEFIILQPETTLEQSMQAAERLRGIIASSTMQIGEELITITISLGVSGIVTGDEIALDKLLELADRALYHSKEIGRNRVSVWKRNSS